MNISKKLLILTFFSVLMLTFFAISGFSAEHSGNMLSDGSLTYTFEGGVLTIEGKAEGLKFDSVLNWSCAGSVWHDEGWNEEITEVLVNADVTYIDEYVLSTLPNCSKITIPSSVTAVYKGGFAGNTKLIDIRVKNADYSSVEEEHFYDLRNMTWIADYTFDGTPNELNLPDAEAPIVLLFGSKTYLSFGKFFQNYWSAPLTCYVYPGSPAEKTMLDTQITTVTNDPDYYICDNIDIKYYKSSIAVTPLSGEIITSNDASWPEGVAYSLDLESGTLYLNTTGSLTFKKYSWTTNDSFSAWKNTWKNAVKRIEVGAYGEILALSGLLGDYPYCKEILFANAVTVDPTGFCGSSLTTIGFLSGYEENVIDLSVIRLQDGDWSTAAYLFENCSSVTNIKFPETNIIGPYFKIGTSMFKNCTSLESITIPSYITDIAAAAFSGCTALKSIHLKNPDITVASDAFSDCSGITIHVDTFLNAEKVNATLASAGIASSVAIAESDSGVMINGGMSFEGYQVRISDYNGLRSIFSYDESIFTLNSGFNFVEYGTICATSENYSSYSEKIGDSNSLLSLKDGEFVTPLENIIKIKVRDTNGYHDKYNINSDGTIGIKTVIVRFENETQIKTDVVIVGYEIWERNGVYYAVFTKGSYSDYGDISLYKVTLGMLNDEVIDLGRSTDSPVWQVLDSCESTPLEISYEGLTALTFMDPANTEKDIIIFLNESGKDITLENISFLDSETRKGLSGYIFEETIKHDFPVHYSYSDIVERLINAEYLASVNIGEVSKEFTSYDRDSQIVEGEYVNWNANDDFGGYIRQESDGGYVIAEMEGAGYISRIWAATPLAGHIKIYIDGAESPIIDMPFEDIFKGSVAPFNYPMLSYNTDSGQGKNCYVPITYNESCKVVVYDNWGEYYIINYTTLTEGTTVESMPAVLPTASKNALSRVNDALTELDGTDPTGKKDPEFEKYTVSSTSSAVKTLTGKGSIRGLLVNVDYDGYNNSYENVLLFKNLQIKIYWDGMETPFVDAPLGDFFGSAYGVTNLRTLMLGVRDDGTFYNYFTMPYLEGARIEISYLGEGSVDISLGVNVEEMADENIMYYSTLFNRGEYDENPQKHPDYHFLSVEGSGRIVGVTLHASKCTNEVDPASTPGSPWWGEGDEKFYIDGETFPSWYGTGTEDFFGYAWCDGTVFNRAYHAQSYCVGGSNYKGNRSVTRIMLADNIPFNESFEGYFEKYYSDEHVKFGFTTYFYMSADSTAARDNYTKEDLEGYFFFDPGVAASNFTEGEYLRVNSVSEGGSYYVQSMSYFGTDWSEDNHMMITGLQPGGEIEFVLPAEASGKYVALISFTYAPDYAKVKVGINGKQCDTVFDLYDASVVADVMSYAGEFDITKGFTNTLTLTVEGKNDSSTGYYMGIDFIVLVPANEFTSLEEFDLSVYTSVERSNTK